MRFSVKKCYFRRWKWISSGNIWRIVSLFELLYCFSGGALSWHGSSGAVDAQTGISIRPHVHLRGSLHQQGSRQVSAVQVRKLLRAAGSALLLRHWQEYSHPELQGPLPETPQPRSEYCLCWPIKRNVLDVINFLPYYAFSAVLQT